MKLAIPLIALTIGTYLPTWSTASESAQDCSSAIDTLVAGIQAQPDHVLMLFQDALQTNPGCRRDLMIKVIESSNPDSNLLTQLIYVARNEFPNEDNAIAEAVLLSAPEFGNIIRDAFSADQAIVTDSLAESTRANRELPAEAMAMDEDIREAIARMTAKVEGKIWPEQDLSGEPVKFKVRDEVRVSRESAGADESFMNNSLPVDQVDERKLVPAPVSIDDTPRITSDIRLDESRFNEGKTASTGPEMADQQSITPAGSVNSIGLPKLPRSSIYHIPAAAKSYRSTIDYEKDDKSRPPLVIRSAPETPSSPK